MRLPQGRINADRPKKPMTPSEEQRDRLATVVMIGVISFAWGGMLYMAAAAVRAWLY